MRAAAQPVHVNARRGLRAKVDVPGCDVELVPTAGERSDEPEGHQAVAVRSMIRQQARGSDHKYPERHERNDRRPGTATTVARSARLR
jgi:hypothetical protein